jgi:hypothetical protein
MSKGETNQNPPSKIRKSVDLDHQGGLYNCWICDINGVLFSKYEFFTLMVGIRKEDDTIAWTTGE